MARFLVLLFGLLTLGLLGHHPDDTNHLGTGSSDVDEGNRDGNTSSDPNAAHHDPTGGAHQAGSHGHPGGSPATDEHYATLVSTNPSSGEDHDTDMTDSKGYHSGDRHGHLGGRHQDDDHHTPSTDAQVSH